MSKVRLLEFKCYMGFRRVVFYIFIVLSAQFVGVNLVSADTMPDDAAALDSRIEGSEAVFRGKVESKRSYYLRRSNGSEIIVTRYKLSLDETFKGRPPVDREVVIEGGTVNGITLTVSDMPVLNPGEELIVLGDETPDGFTPRDRSGGILRIEPGTGKLLGGVLTTNDFRNRINTLKSKAR